MKRKNVTVSSIGRLGFDLCGKGYGQNNYDKINCYILSGVHGSKSVIDIMRLRLHQRYMFFFIQLSLVKTRPILYLQPTSSDSILNYKSHDFKHGGRHSYAINKQYGVFILIYGTFSL